MILTLIVSVLLWLLLLPHLSMMFRSGKNSYSTYSVILNAPDKFVSSINRDSVMMLPFFPIFFYHWIEKMLGMTPLLIEKTRYLMQIVMMMLAMAFPVALITGSVWTGIVAGLVISGTLFSGLGWFQRPVMLVTPLFSKTTVVCGLLLLWLHILYPDNSMIYFAMGLLFLNHPIHAAIIFSILISMGIAGVGAPFLSYPSPVNMLSFSFGPIIFLCSVFEYNHRLKKLKKKKVIPDIEYDNKLRIRLNEARSRNPFALAAVDRRTNGGGIRMFTSPPFLILTAGSVAILLGIRLFPGSILLFDGGMMKSFSSCFVMTAQLALLAGVTGYLLQLVGADILRNITLMKFCFSRATVYISFFSSILWAIAFHETIIRGGICIAICCLFAIGWNSKHDHSWLLCLSFFPFFAMIPGNNTNIWLIINMLLFFLTAGFVLECLLVKCGYSDISIFRYCFWCFRILPDDIPQITSLLVASSLACLHFFRLPVTVYPNVDPAIIFPLTVALLLVFILYNLYIRKIYISSQYSSWGNLQQWANKYTSPGELFMCPPQYNEFELFSHRPNLFESNLMFPLYVDASIRLILAVKEVFGDKISFDKYCFQRTIKTSYQRITPLEVEAFRKYYDIRYLVLENEYASPKFLLNYKQIYVNTIFVVFDLKNESPTTPGFSERKHHRKEVI